LHGIPSVFVVKIYLYPLPGLKELPIADLHLPRNRVLISSSMKTGLSIKKDVQTKAKTAFPIPAELAAGTSA